MIPDSDVEKALDYMRDAAEPCAKWKAERVYLTEYRKTLKAELMGQSNASTAVEREQFAYSHDHYKTHLLGMKQAVHNDEKHRYLVKAAAAKVDAWRTQQSNRQKRARPRSLVRGPRRPSCRIPSGRHRSR